MLPIHTILHPTDFSERSECAFRLACAMARDHGARLVVVHVVPPADEVEIVRRADAAFYEQLWGRIHLLRPADPAVPVEYRMADGEPGKEILHAAEECGCNLIVMGTHGRTGLRRLLMGSVAEEVMRSAPCPVLTVKAPFPLQEPAPAPEPEVYMIPVAYT
jgi:nucleotide-binding universal stress UspA family protein